MGRPVLATAWLATMAPAGHAKSRPGITPCGLIRDCWFPSSIAVLVMSGEERKGSRLLRKNPPADRGQRTGRHLERPHGLAAQPLTGTKNPPA